MTAAAAIAPGCLSGGGRRWSHLDAVVLAGTRLEHYRRALVRPDRPWLRLGTVSVAATGPGRLIRRDGALLAVVPEAGGAALYRLGREGWEPARGAAPASPGEPGGPRTPSAEQLGVSAHHLRAVAVGDGGGWPQALTDEDGSVFGYHRRPDGAWERNSCLRLTPSEPFAIAATESVKLAQVTADVDATPTPWGQRTPTLSASLTTAGIRGTDLGIRVDHADRTFLLFGDTHWSRRPWLSARDAIAEVAPDESRAPGLLPGVPAVRFHGSPLKLTGRRAGRITMREYDVPLDGFSAGGALYGFFSSNHFRARRVMGRSVLARAVETDLRLDPAARRRPVRFEVVGAFSERHFITVSAHLRPAAEVQGCDGDGEVLLVWGTGAYRASEPRLALLDQAALGALASGAGGGDLAVRYWAGSGWSHAEGDAVALFGPAALGELSVRWVPAADRYLMLTASAPGDPVGPSVVLRAAPRPDGPWSPPLRLLDWVATGMSLDPHTRFIKASREGDPVGDRIFRAQAGGTGAAYAPYLFDATVDGAEVVLRYTLSTWNPYQVVLMQHRLTLTDLRKL